MRSHKRTSLAACVLAALVVVSAILGLFSPAWSAFRLERADGSRPAKGLAAITAPRAPVEPSPVTVRVPAPRRIEKPVPPPGHVAGGRSVSSTAYCLTGV